MNFIQKITIYAIPLIFAITIHEAAHAYVANKYGDNTAKSLNRLSLNPINHIDLFGTVLFPLIGIILGGFIFGWAKPVPINFNKLNNPKKNMFWVAFAGPAVNLFMALIWAIIYKSSSYLDSYFGVPLNLMSQAGIAVNISLMVLNLLPILPLDGGRMVFSLLPKKYAISYGKIEPYGIWIVIILLILGILPYIIQPFYSFFINNILSLFQ